MLMSFSSLSFIVSIAIVKFAFTSSVTVVDSSPSTVLGVETDTRPSIVYSFYTLFKLDTSIIWS